MPFLAILHVAIAIYFAVHAVRTGRNTVWLFVLLSFPFLGSLVYLFAEFLPEQRHSRLGRRAGAALRQIIDPQRELREARLALEQTPSMGNRLRLAQALLEADQAGEALPHFQACAQGVFAHDAAALSGLARCQAAAGQEAAAVASLRRLFADQPARYSGDLALLMARLLAVVHPEEAEAAFEVALRTHSGIETNSAWGQFLLASNRKAEARPVLEQVLKDARLSSAHARDVNRHAIAAAEAALDQLGRAG